MHIGQQVSMTFHLLKKPFLPFWEFSYECYMFSKLRPKRSKHSLGDFFSGFVGSLLSACSSLSQFSLTSGALYQIWLKFARIWFVNCKLDYSSLTIFLQYLESMTFNLAWDFLSFFLCLAQKWILNAGSAVILTVLQKRCWYVLGRQMGRSLLEEMEWLCAYR